MLLFVIADLLFGVKVQSKKYEIRICNELSLRVILEHPSARELYREVLWSWQFVVCCLPFIVSGLLCRIKVQSKKYEIRICNELSLRVILEHPSARELYREVLWSWQWQFTVGSHSRQWAIVMLLFVIAVFLFGVKVQSKKYKIQIDNAMSLRAHPDSFRERSITGWDAETLPIAIGTARQCVLKRVTFTHTRRVKRN